MPAFNQSLLLVLTTTLLMTSCASISNNHANAPSQNSQSTGLYSFPKEIDSGYWARVKDIRDEAVVVDFNGQTAQNYRFKCQADGSYRQLSVESVNLIPSATGMQVQYADEPIFSELRVVDYQPRQSLKLKQTFTHVDLKNVVHEDREFSYRYTSTLKPLCGS